MHISKPNNMKTNTKIWIVVFLVSLVGGSITSSYLFSSISIIRGEIVLNFSTLAWVCVAFDVINLISGNVLFFKFLKTRKLSTVLFLSTVPVTLIFGGIMFGIFSINNYSNTPAVFIKTALNINTANNNRYYWLVVIAIVYLIVISLTFVIATRPIKKIETVTKRLAYGEVRDKINIGGTKQFQEIENSLKKINENYKIKDDVIKQTSVEYEKFIPKKLIKFLGKKSILELEVGSQVKKTATILFCNIKNSGAVSKTLSLEQNFNYINSYLNVVAPIIRKFDGFVDKYLENGILSVFISPQNAITCAMNISRAIKQKNLDENMPKFEVGLAIHTDEIIFGVVGDEQRKTPTILTNSMELVNELDEINEKFGSIMLITKNTLNALPTSFKLAYRYIAELDGEGVEQSVFECLEVFPRQKREKLYKHHLEFENGVRAFQKGNFEQAKQIFEKVYRQEKDDKPCYVYYNKSSESLGQLPLNVHE